MKKLISIFAFALLLTACGSNNKDSGSSDDSSSSGGYISCVLEYTKLRNEGVITATDAEISSECAGSSLP